MLKQIPMTIKGAEQLKEELQRLKSVDRPNIIQAISEARAQGDLSENAEYESAKAVSYTHLTLPTILRV